MEMLEKQKADFRTVIRKQLKALPEEEKRILDRRIADRVLSLPAVADAGAVYGYASLSWEAGTGEILKELWKRKCIVCLPRVMGETMEFFVTESENDLTEGTFHIMEPRNGCRSAEEYHSEIASEKMDREFHQKSRHVFSTAPILVPGMGFTESGIRLGKGGGYYDRYLEKHPGHKTIALAYEFQILHEIPAEPYDRSVDMIVTEKQVIQCNIK